MAKKRRARRQTKPSTPSPRASKRTFDLTRCESNPYFFPALGVCGLLAGLLLFDANLSLSGDNANFINLGRSLADGHGLSETIGGGDPVPHTKYPFGFPLLLAMVEIAFPGNLIALKGLVVLLYAISIPLTYVLIRRFADLPLALGTSALCLVSPLLLDFSHQVMSEIPFLTVSLLALVLLHRAHNAESPNGPLALATVAIVATYYIRSAGILLVGTGVLFFVLHKKWKEAGIVAGGSFLLALPWQIRTAALGGNEYIRSLLSINPYRPEQGPLTFPTLIERIVANFEIYGLHVIPRIFVPSFGEINAFVGLVFSGLILYVLIAGLMKRRLLAVYLTCYLGLHMFWPQVWSDARFLVPAVPVLFYAALASVGELLGLLAKTLKKTASRAGPVFFCLFLLVSNLVATHALADRIGRFPPHWGNYFAAAEWIKNNTDPHVKIACRKPFLMNAVANRKTSGYPWKTPDQIVADFEKNGIGIVVVDQLGFRSTPEFLVPAVRARADRFKVIHVVPNPDTYVLSFE